MMLSCSTPCNLCLSDLVAASFGVVMWGLASPLAGVVANCHLLTGGPGFLHSGMLLDGGALLLHDFALCVAWGTGSKMIKLETGIVDVCHSVFFLPLVSGKASRVDRVAPALILVHA